ncbi:MAG: DNA-formamidopyrimidine glycosylase [Candidatus Izemoplasmatales bacterium]
MPELPEVETIKRTLAPALVGRTIASVTVRCDRIVHGATPAEFAARLQGQTVRALGRFGKYLFFTLDDITLVSHLRMEGKYFLKPAADPYEKHEHVVFDFTDGGSLRYHDTRKFGTMEIVPKGTEKHLRAIEAMGPEPASPAFSGAYLARKGGASARPVKSFLLDQRIVSGLGNIYVDETLGRSRIHPETLARHLIRSEWNAVAAAAKAVVAQAVEDGGTTIRSYVSSLGVTGRFQTELVVHMRKGLPCHACGTPIVKTVVGGRGTYLCPRCQVVKPGKGLVVGLTGGIASGKSTVGRLFRKAGIAVLDADVVYKDLSKPGNVLYNDIIGAFGEGILAADGSIDRAKLGAVVFADAAARERLNALSHPAVRTAMLAWIDARKAGGDEIIVASVPLLFEAGFDSFCDVTVAVWCPPRIQLERLMKRNGLSRADALRRIGAQMPLKQKSLRATHTIDNADGRKALAESFTTTLALIRS